MTTQLKAFANFLNLIPLQLLKDTSDKLGRDMQSSKIQERYFRFQLAKQLRYEADLMFANLYNAYHYGFRK